MGVRLRRLYRLASADDFLDIAENLPQIDWVVEAGVHDATDTVEIIRRVNPTEYLGFEPDFHAYKKALRKLETQNLKDKVSLMQMALSDERGFVTLVTPTSLGSGQTQVEGNQGEVASIPIFDFLVGKNNRGLLWLDVEGHAERVIRGARNLLKNFSLMKIEVQMKYMDANRQRDAYMVHRLANKDFILIRAPLHPGFFGDVVYLRKDLATITKRVNSFMLVLIFFTLHHLVYPLIRRNRHL